MQPNIQPDTGYQKRLISGKTLNILLLLLRGWVWWGRTGPAPGFRHCPSDTIQNLNRGVHCTEGWPKKTGFSVKNFMTEGKGKLEWRRVRKYIRFIILFIPWSSNCKKTFSRIFGNFNTQNLLWIYIIFHIFPNQKIREKNNYKFQRHSLLTALHKKKIWACAQRIFWFWFLCFAGA